MGIVVNTRCLQAKLTGVQRYTGGILGHFPESEYDLIYPEMDWSRGARGHFWEQFTLPQKMGKKDLLWSPSNSGPIAFSNQVLTIHDIAEIDHPEWHGQLFSKWYSVLLPLLTKRVSRIIAISDFTKQRLIERLAVEESKIEVIYNGVEESFFADSAELYPHIPFKKYILALGSVEPRKNLARLMDAWNNVSSKVDDSIGLVIVGGQGSAKVFGSYSLDQNAKRVYFTGHLDDKYIVSIYRNALFFCYLSFYEGFGLPPLEAMASGCPVLVSNHEAISEVVNGSGISVDPYSLAEIENGLLQYCSDDELIRRNSIKGLERAKYFSWKKASVETWDVIQSCT